jgi:hypothetical protein
MLLLVSPGFLPWQEVARLVALAPMNRTASSCSNVSNVKRYLTLAQAQDDEAARSFAAENALPP